MSFGSIYVNFAFMGADARGKVMAGRGGVINNFWQTVLISEPFIDNVTWWLKRYLAMISWQAPRLQLWCAKRRIALTCFAKLKCYSVLATDHLCRRCSKIGARQQQCLKHSRSVRPKHRLWWHWLAKFLVKSVLGLLLQSAPVGWLVSSLMRC